MLIFTPIDLPYSPHMLNTSAARFMSWASPALPPEPRVHWVDLALALLGVLGASGVVMAVGRGMNLHTRTRNRFRRVVLWSLVCGLAGYLFYGLGLPGSGFLENVTPGLRGFLAGSAAGLLPLVAVFWLSLHRAAPYRHDDTVRRDRGG